MHPVGQVIDHNERREFQSRGAQHPHGILHVQGAPVFDEDRDEAVIRFIDKYITCAIPDKEQYPKLHKLVTTVQIHGHSQTCEKKKGVKCRFKYPVPPSLNTRIVRKPDCDAELAKEKRKIIDTVLANIYERTDLTGIPLTQILSECNITEDEYFDALDYVSSRVTILYKRKPSEQNVSPYNTVILSLMQSNMNIQYVTGMYGVIKYLTSYMCKPERTMSELMKKASKEATNRGVQDKLWAIGNVFTTKREVSTDEAIVRALSLPMRSSKIAVDFIVTGLKEDRTRALKSPEILQLMNPDDTNIYTLNILDKYANRPDFPAKMDDMCLADFATNYVHHKAHEPDIDSDDIRNYTTAVSSFNVDVEESEEKSEIITLKGEMGKMRKRRRPCVMRYHKVSKMKDPELYHLILLQLYLPWRDESALKEDFSSYQEMYEHVELDIKPNILTHEPYFEQLELDLDDMLDNVMDDDSDYEGQECDTNEFNFLNPDLLDVDVEDNDGNDINFTPATASVENRSLSREETYTMCSQLNEGQLEVFNYVMRYAVEYMLNERNGRCLPDPIYVFLSGAGGVGKSYVTKAMVENLRNVLKFHLQDFARQPSVSVTASTGKAACDLNGTTLHTGFMLPLKGRRALKEGSTLNTLKKKYRFLNVIFTDEMSMTGLYTFDSLNTQLQKIKGDKRDFGGVSIIGIGDLFQLPPVKMFGVYSMINKRINDPWLKFKLHELTEIVRQSGDPRFAALLLRLREGKHTADDIADIRKLEDTDTTTWPDEFTHLYMTNYLAGSRNDECLAKLESETNPIITVNAKDRGPKNTTVPGNIPFSYTGNLKKHLQMCEGAKIMLTKNIDIDDKLVNGTLATIIKVDRVGNDVYGYPKGRVYIKCDDKSAGGKYKDARLIQELKECVPIQPELGEFHYKGKKIYRKQFPFILAHGITTHKSQGATFDYFCADLDRTPPPGKRMNHSVTEGMFYTMLSRGKLSNHIKLKNFVEEVIKVHQGALAEMERLRKESVLDSPHPLKKFNSPSISYLNIVKWTKHIEHFLSDKAHPEYSCVFCFTETNIVNEQYQRIKSYLPEWDDIHHSVGHGLTVCYNTAKVNVLKKYSYMGVLEILPVLLEIDKEIIFLVLVYRPPGPIGNFVTVLIQVIDQLLSEYPIHAPYRTIVLGDFNWDQMLPQHVSTFAPFSSHFNLHQRSNYSTHIKGGILDLVFDDKVDTDVEWMFTPYSDHFILLIDL